ncbi:MAG TPA: TonB family protein [Gemmatimonadaceae bacterium]|nr:TonB family protein [Gemmatimonadaceae bacterium]
MSLADFPLRWRWTESRGNMLPAQALSRIRPLSAARAAELAPHAVYLCDERRELSREMRADGEVAEMAAWLRTLRIDPATRVVVCWDEVSAVVTDWALFCRYWDDFCYAGSDRHRGAWRALHESIIFASELGASPSRSQTMIRTTARSLVELMWLAAISTAVALPLHAQQSTPVFLTGPCSRTDSARVVSLESVVASPEVAPMQKAGMRPPAAPSETQHAGYDGKVVVAFVVNAKGRVDPASVFVMSSSDSALSRWACRAAPDIQFSPARDHGHAVAAQAMLPFVFRGPPAVKDSV